MRGGPSRTDNGPGPSAQTGVGWRSVPSPGSRRETGQQEADCRIPGRVGFSSSFRNCIIPQRNCNPWGLQNPESLPDPFAFDDGQVAINRGSLKSIDPLAGCRPFDLQPVDLLATAQTHQDARVVRGQITRAIVLDQGMSFSINRPANSGTYCITGCRIDLPVSGPASGCPRHRCFGAAWPAARCWRSECPPGRRSGNRRRPGHGQETSCRKEGPTPS